MRKIINPFVKRWQGEYNCFGCSPYNDSGLQLEFWDSGDALVTRWKPGNHLAGWNNILHGGIQATIIDEIASWVVFTKCKTSGVTSELNVRYLKPVFISKGGIEVKASLETFEKGIAKIACSLFDGEGAECASALVTYFCYPEEIARRKFNYPGIEAFYEE